MIRLVIHLPDDQAERLYWALHSGELAHLGIVDVDYMRKDERETDNGENEKDCPDSEGQTSDL